MKLQLIPLEDGDLSVNDLVRLSKTRPVIVTRKGKPILQATNVAGGDLECLALANDPKFMKLLADSERSYFRNGGVSSEQVMRELGLDATKPKRRGRALTTVRSKSKRQPLRSLVKP